MTFEEFKTKFDATIGKMSAADLQEAVNSYGCVEDTSEVHWEELEAEGDWCRLDEVTNSSELALAA